MNGSSLSRRMLWIVPALAALSLASAQAATGTVDAFFAETFDSPSTLSSHWSGATIVTDTHGSGYALKVVNSAVGTTFLHATLPGSLLAGRHVVISGQVKGTAISTPPHPYNGAVINLVYQYADGTYSTSDQAEVPAGTFDWMNFCFPTVVPDNVVTVYFEVGLQSVMGTAWFDELKIEADPEFFLEDFEDAAEIASTWHGASYSTVTHNGGEALSLTSTSTTGSTVVVATLPAAVYSGRRLVVTGLVKATGVSAKPNAWNGIKVMITYTTSDGAAYTSYPQANIDVGTFDWRHVYAVVPLPANVTGITLTLGLEKVTGTAAFDDIRIEAAPLLKAESFDDGSTAVHTRWPGSAYTLVTVPTADLSLAVHGTGQAMEITNASTTTSTDIAMTLPVAAIRGRQVILRALVKATNVSAPVLSYNGIAVKMSYTIPTTPPTTMYPQVTIPASMYNVAGNWTMVYVPITIPADATAATVYVGVEKATGTVDFDDIEIKADSFSPYWTNPTPNYTGHTVSRLRGMMVNTTLPNVTATHPDDVAALATWNNNVVRWPLGGADSTSTNAQGLTLSNFSTVLNTEIATLDAALPTLSSHGWAVTLDLHELSEHQFDNSATQQQLVNAWRTLVTHYVASAYAAKIWCYEVHNEPHDDGWQESLLTLNELGEQVALAIREIDPTKAIVLEPYNADPRSLPNFRPARTNHVVYSIHYYLPWDYVSQGVVESQPYTAITYPGTIDGAYWDATKVAAAMQPAVDFQNKYQVSMYVGEFSVIRWAAGGAQFLTDCMSAFEANGWDWTYCCFRAWDGWDLETNSTVPRSNYNHTVPLTDGRKAAVLGVMSGNTVPGP